jgi:hypothetical protein
VCVYIYIYIYIYIYKLLSPSFSPLFRANYFLRDHDRIFFRLITMQCVERIRERRACRVLVRKSGGNAKTINELHILHNNSLLLRSISNGDIFRPFLYSHLQAVHIKLQQKHTNVQYLIVAAISWPKRVAVERILK